MQLQALATDYDGTLAADGLVSEAGVAALQRLRDSGRKLLLVTGRELSDLKILFPQLTLFDAIVAENGALLYLPQSDEEIPLAPPPPEDFAATLSERGVGPISVGRAIVATWEPHETTVLEVIRERGLELQITFNKGAVMILPTGVNKASGLDHALKHLGLDESQVVGVGDAENDHAFLKACGVGVAVDNAIPALKETADFVTTAPRTQGVIELIDHLIANDAAFLGERRAHGVESGAP